MTTNWFSAHTHSAFSSLDGMTPVEQIVAKVAKLNQPALGLTDHGNMAGTVQLYLSAKKHNIVPFPGVEAYLLDPKATMEDSKAKRYHIGFLALNLNGYQNLIKMVSKSYTRPNFNRFPRIDLTDLAELSQRAGKDVAVMTGCFFGLVQQTLINDGISKAENIVKMYAKLFPHTFVEIQNHDIEHTEDDNVVVTTDNEIVMKLVGIASRVGLPIMATQDSHYLNSGDKTAHSLMKRMVYGGVEDAFPGDSFHIASDEWVSEHYTKNVWSKAEAGAEHLLSLNHLVIPPLDKYKAQIPSLVENPQKAVAKLCVKALKEMNPKKFQEYEDRLNYELDIIKDLDMAGYFMLVHNYVEWCNEKEICIEARGSANGSLVCFLLGITQVDPIKWNLLFDRFLSKDRLTPPDIDMDVENISRERLVGYLERNFDTVRISTWSKLGTREEDGKGSILVTYKAYLKGNLESSTEQQKMYAQLQTIDDVKNWNKKDYKGLKLINDMGGVFRSYGVHAGGVLLSGHNQKIADFVPKMLVASSDTPVSQFNMDDVEKLGFLKLDILGQTTLSVMRNCQELMGKKNPTSFNWIPENDSESFKILREGRTDNGIFHFEGYTKAKGGRAMGIKSVKDTILATGLFMPGAMNTGQTEMYLERRNNPELREKVRYIHPIFESALKDTYGTVIFQEQVINIMRGLGMSVEGVNVFFKIVKTSGAGSVEENNIRLAEMREEFNELCLNVGISIKDTQKAWDLTAGFVSYGFNRAHATGYGLRSYRCAYLKAHYPMEFMTALLQAWAGTEKETLYIREARRIGIRILPPDVNISEASWTLDRKAKAIRKGLISIKGVGVNASESISSNAPFTSIDDLIDRTESRSVTGGKSYKHDKTMNGVLLKLKDAGALQSLLQEKRN